ncbi:MAG: riboflavin synthase [gamma proteobacterium symbiont of Bathyaustriella thionipta]|nr:riboflavin synthase [gamma proteobacterium symbiont of Bathyaustriella thionipta]MCU7950173.1 riboflavin synthase [gamma proteobacterium symbiont of Bathyaustriella thionipta]MCU7952985.1 riboflavin synthase [gamma proteobacterium symbiont of Bathyaustriella thionipta]MCU7956715.1 riboflavin synthase [gamma proteobacterium symbiont of Bathyaustriella thionipta]MCU7966375.1 riboflavin synthase [gamma proteobacterium symbiont of Bathyaustriella thionipta]
MFTGIIQAIGQIAAIEPKGQDSRFYIKTGPLDLSDVAIGDSIATNGVCLTAVVLPGDGFWADVSGETLTKTSFKQIKVGSRVNLEKALLPTTHLGGHIVSGHVDGLGKIIERSHAGRSIHFKIKAPDELAKYIAAKGSICVNGISLTINELNGAIFELNIVPHTLDETTLASAQAGDEVNLEVDIIARYLERLLLGDKAAQAAPEQGVTMTLLAENGFLSR